MGLDSLLLNSVSQKGLIYNIKNLKTTTLLFHGVKNSGKLHFAYSIAKALNCHKLDFDFCNTCPSCKKINSSIHPDLITLNTNINKNKILILLETLKERLKAKSSENPKIQHPNSKLFIKSSFYFNSLVNRYLNDKSALKKGLKGLDEKINDAQMFLDSDINSLERKDIEKKLTKLIKLVDEIETTFKNDNIGLEHVKDVLKKLYTKTKEARFRVVIIYDTYNLKLEGANALLKGIEEPPNGNIIILITAEISKIIPTISSRATKIHFPPKNKELIKLILKNEFMIEDEIKEDEIKDDVKSVWDYFYKDSTLDLVYEFFDEVALNYQKGDAIFRLTDKILKESSIELFLENIIKVFIVAKERKRNILLTEEKGSSLYLSYLADKQLDEHVEYATNIVRDLRSYNINAGLSLSSFLIGLSRSYNLCLEKERMI